ncbi:IS21 family transposase [Persicobacter sp. CCB-QB2]|uniref:IS21 family transposase n=1 Tax=Persicobacter sp. CCB-QB2 TaxID=1561025 RepID=UPI000ABBC6FC|nr:IS21 family transposase [Persicobacter sp. CCB-QB2]
MNTKQEILLRKYRDHQSQRTIVKELKVGRRTVRKYLQEFEELRPQHNDFQSALRASLAIHPKYDSSNRTNSKLTDKVIARIESLLEENDRRQGLGLKKQLLKAVDIHECLEAEGYSISYSSVCAYLHKKKANRRNEAYIRQQIAAGSMTEFDWGEIKLEIDGKLRVIQMAVFTSGYSNHRFACLFNRQDSIAFQEAHVRYFANVEGVYREVVYDNMRVAVKSFISKTEKEPTEALINLKAHYGFSHRFCNVRKGNEKGKVERSVEYVRRKSFAGKISFNSLEEANDYLQVELDKINNRRLTGKEESAKELLELERDYLLDHSGGFHCFEREEVRVDKYATVCYKTNRYSVPDHLVGKFITLEVTSNMIKAFYQEELVASHSRVFGTHQWAISLHHYLPTLAMKPGALAKSVALDSDPFLKGLFDDHFSTNPRSFIEMLAFCQKEGIDRQRLVLCVDQIKRKQPTVSITWELIRVLLSNKEKETPVININSTILHHAQQTISQASKLLKG